MTGYVGIAITVLFTAFGQILIKREIDRTMAERTESDALPALLFQLLMNPLVLAGLALAGCAAVGWILAMMKLPFNVAYPIIVGLLATLPVIGALILGEAITLPKLGAIALVFGGVLMLAVQR